ncbi:hypothetical protein EDC04DRAFT_2121420 [Pisolithus marmoratus]|nr:hypothetical protein EDC04DRAFT_2121420 [Pisolithus marmoratus]
MFLGCMQDIRARADESVGQGTSEGWGTWQIVTPVTVGVGLILCFVAYFVWQRRRQPSPNARPARADGLWYSLIGKFKHIFSLERRICHRVTPSSQSMTLDDSMDSPCVKLDLQCKSRQFRSDSTDSSTPLNGSHDDNYSPSRFVKSGSRSRRHRRWSQQFLRLLGLGPQEVKHESPSAAWRIDVSSSGHGQDANERENRIKPGCVVAEDPEEEEEEHPEVLDLNRVIQIGDENFSSIASTTDEPTRATVAPHPMPPIPSRDLQLKLGLLPKSRSTQESDPPPGYKRIVAASAVHHPLQHQGLSRDDPSRPAAQLSDPSMLFPPSVRAVGYGSPLRHGRTLSSESLLVSQTPMTPPGMY